MQLHGFQSGGYKLQLIKDHIEGDCYIKWINYGPRNQCNAIDLVPTKCHYGGQRQWFRCPACSKRVGILYEHEDHFKCRTCLGLCYASQKVNYRTIAPTIAYMIKLRKTVPVMRTYKGKLTQRGVRYEKLRAKAEMGLVLFGPRYANR